MSVIRPMNDSTCKPSWVCGTELARELLQELASKLPPTTASSKVPA
jgi:hypothetical protein